MAKDAFMLSGISSRTYLHVNKDIGENKNRHNFVNVANARQAIQSLFTVLVP